MSPKLGYEWKNGAFCDAPFFSSYRNTTPGGGCFSTALVTQGAPRWLEAHVARLLRDAKQIGLTPPASDLVAHAFCELGLKHFRVGRGIVRVDLQCDAAGATQVLATSRSLIDVPSAATAFSYPVPHPGPSAFPGAKLVTRDFFTAAHEAACAANCQEALLFDADNFLVEGSYSSILVVRQDDILCTPPLTRGSVNGITRRLLLDAVAALRECDLTREEVVHARELYFANAVRGVVPIVTLDAKPVGDGVAGVWATRLQESLQATMHGHPHESL